MNHLGLITILFAFTTFSFSQKINTPRKLVENDSLFHYELLFGTGIFEAVGENFIHETYDGNDLGFNIGVNLFIYKNLGIGFHLKRYELDLAKDNFLGSRFHSARISTHAFFGLYKLRLANQLELRTSLGYSLSTIKNRKNIDTNDYKLNFNGLTGGIFVQYFFNKTENIGVGLGLDYNYKLSNRVKTSNRYNEFINHNQFYTLNFMLVIKSEALSYYPRPQNN
ncbi:hypothetical protein [Psychroflexus sp. ALD_RP9]|uniref:hypothetical protein n=1 Tax=Psychroflexus sp. ALD_RP9 TaxID=2777186 RepID=UPI001A8CC8E9|nr:hypothetical protein [Psychroflexus sp. ALD_RP9]QSS97441.1 hypothetical protein IMZ30_01635 [Psychroflexus sp. ALD_RP9]